MTALHALTLAQIALPHDHEKHGWRVGKLSPWWSCKAKIMNESDDCPSHCTRKRPYEIAPGLFVCKQCFDLDES